MSQSTIRSEIARLLKTEQKVVSLLGDQTLGANNKSIVLAGRLSQGFDTSVPLPAIAIRESGNLGFPQQLPFFDLRFNVYAVDAMPAPNQISYVKIDLILQECIEALNRVQINTNTSYYSAFRPQYDNYISTDLIDGFTQLPMKYARFCVYGAMLRYNEK